MVPWHSRQGRNGLRGCIRQPLSISDTTPTPLPQEAAEAAFTIDPSLTHNREPHWSKWHFSPCCVLTPEKKTHKVLEFLLPFGHLDDISPRSGAYSCLQKAISSLLSPHHDLCVSYLVDLINICRWLPTFCRLKFRFDWDSGFCFSDVFEGTRWE